MRVAIYARYSSDLQADASIEDQFRIVEEYAKREGWIITKRYDDQALSGSNMMRPGIQALMQDALEGKFDIVMSEALDRLSRDQEDIAGIYKRLQFFGIKLITLSEGEVSNLHIGLKGTMNALFLKDLAAKTHRGLRGRVEQGKSGGGRAYGYKNIRRYDAKGELIRGEREIDEEHAMIVKRIYEEYIAGKSPLAIVFGLNREGIPGPTGKQWTQSAINGCRKRGTGILNNELYIGRMVWNRQTYLTDPDTGKRISRPNPKEDWVITEVPELRIIDQETWDKVRERQSRLNSKASSYQGKKRPKHLLSGIIKCGCCGSGYNKISQDLYGCFAARKKGTCDNYLNIRQDKLEGEVLKALQLNLLNPEMCEVFCKEYVEYMKRLQFEKNTKRRSFEKELHKRIRDDDRMMEMLLDGIASTSTMKNRINENAQRIEELKKLLEETEEEKILLHPNMAQHYRKEITNLIQELNDPEHAHEAAYTIQGLIDRVVLTPKEDGTGLYIDLIGDLAGILKVAAGGSSNIVKNKLVKQVQEASDALDVTSTLYANHLNDRENLHMQDQLVAGAGFEPATFRL